MKEPINVQNCFGSCDNLLFKIIQKLWSFMSVYFHLNIYPMMPNVFAHHTGANTVKVPAHDPCLMLSESDSLLSIKFKVCEEFFFNIIGSVILVQPVIRQTKKYGLTKLNEYLKC